MNSSKILSIRNLKKSFGGTEALRGVGLDLAESEVHALVGENGAGKSTLVKIISGVLHPDSGEIIFDRQPVSFRNVQEARRAGINVVYQELSLAVNLSVAENISAAGSEMNVFRRMELDNIGENAISLLDSAGIDPAARVSNLGIAAQQMVEIAGAVSRNCRILILDEPTASLTEDETSNLFRIINLLKEQGVTVIYISHRLEEIFRIADRVTVFRDGEYVGTRETAQIDQDGLVRLMIGREMKAMFPERRNNSGAALLEIRNLSGNGFRNISMDIRAGEIIGFAGLTGAGRTELFTALFGLNAVYSGHIFYEGREVVIRNAGDALLLGIAYLPEDRKQSGLFSSMTVRDNIIAASLDSHSRRGILDKRRIRENSGNTISNLSVKVSSDLAEIYSLSGGNQQKVLLGRWMLTQPRIFIADEPTRGIDVGAKQEVFRLLRSMADSGVAVVMISSEMEEVLGMSNRIFSMYRGEINGVFEGGNCSEKELGPRVVGVGGNIQ